MSSAEQIEDDQDELEDDQQPFLLEQKELNEDYLLEISGEVDLRKIDRIEMFYEGISSLADLHRCSNLRKISLIGNELTSIPDFSPLKNSLQTLWIISQQIVTIDNIGELVNLRELYLQSNRITRLENLGTLTKLHTLWLFSNDIPEIENLQDLTELKCLWLQENPISKAPSVELQHNINLQTLDLSGTEISDLKSLKAMSALGSLCDLSFANEMFNPAPVALQEGYRNFSILHLTQIQSLDGQAVYESERNQVADLYMENVRAFNVRLEVLKRQNRDLTEDIRARRRQLDQKERVVRTQLLEQFGVLEQLVSSSRAACMNEYQRHLQLRMEKRKAFDRSLQGLRKKYDQECERLIQKEMAKIKAEEKYFLDVKAERERETEEALALNAIQYATVGNVIVYPLEPSQSECKFVESVFGETMYVRQPIGTVSSTTPISWQLQRVYKVHNSRAARAYDKALKRWIQAAQQAPAQAGAQSQPSAASLRGIATRVYYVAEVKALQTIVQNGFQIGRGSEDATSSPARAAAISGGGTFHAVYADAGHAHEALAQLSDKNLANQHFAVLICQLVLSKVAAFKNESLDAPVASDLNQWLKKIAADCGVFCVEGSKGKKVYGVLDGSLLLPEYYVRYSVHRGTAANPQGNAPKLDKHVEPYIYQSFNEVSFYPTLVQIEREADAEIQQYQMSLETSYLSDLVISEALPQQLEKTAKLKGYLASLQQQLYAERVNRSSQ